MMLKNLLNDTHVQQGIEKYFPGWIVFHRILQYSVVVVVNVMNLNHFKSIKSNMIIFSSNIPFIT